ncbi:hypothetical protein BB559_000808 [Furculomyces boomerangus]|uniref:protein kinase C n=2 Tax=Harpellales TaxID=61421 RepID=A0A2T9Z404_9FUNG|nr:hypothetical protein BB559_000808 [Furculomyces boomerangus]PVZ98679.1 hypothetical protein BB558_005312 [Smittium angustum]
MNSPSSVDLEGAINETKRKLWNEEMYLNAAKSMRTQHTNKNTIAEIDSQILKLEKRIQFLQDSLNNLNLRLKNKKDPVASSNSSAAQNSQLISNLSSSFVSKLDLRKASAALSNQKISLKMHEIAYKLQVEKKLSEATSRMASIYTTDYIRGNKRKMTQVTEASLVLNESRNKIRLLEQAFKNYQTLYVEYIDNQKESEDTIDQVHEIGLRRPLSGKLELNIISARFLQRAPTRSKKIQPETYVQVKIDGAIKASTKPSKTCTWNESFELVVNKASEIEFCLIERVEQDVLVGIMWIKLLDVFDETRKQQAPENSAAGWATANQIDDNSSVVTLKPGGGQMHSGTVGWVGSGEKGIQSGWDVEPSGCLELWINFTKDAVKRRIPEGLGRKAAVRKRRGQCVEMYRHHFYEFHTYTIAKCAVCEEYLVNSVGQQCDDCRLFVHEKCITKVVTRCFVGTASEDSPEHEKDPADIIRHRIPHRWELSTSLGANWCCHCGTMVTLGRKIYKCSECSVVCHSNCSTFVPNFCGMKPLRAYEILVQIQPIMPKPLFVENRNTISKHSVHKKLSSDTLNKPSPLPQRDPEYQQKAKHPTPTPPQLAVEPYNRQNPDSHISYEKHNHQQNIPKPSFQSTPKASPQPKPAVVNYPNATQKLVVGADLDYNKPANKHGVLQSIDKLESISEKKYGTDDFKFLAVLGKGNFGKVMLAEEKKTKGLYAIKILKKQFIVENDEFESTRSEKRVLLIANKDRHPFLVGLHSCFQTDSRIFFVMEYIAGGDLMLHIQKQQFSERRAKFYACEVLLGLEYFHKNNIVYRDLKLDNIMLGADGHIKIADYGLCKENMGYGATTHTFCGTPEFMAPEIVLEQRYGKAVDWWAFGVLIYEMLLGQSPFRGEDEDEIFDSILEDEVLYPVNMSRDSVSICQALLERDPTKRLGAGVGDADDVKRHPFFKGVNWLDYLDKQIAPPFTPQITNRVDISNFDSEFTREKPNLTMIKYKISTEDQVEFSDFDYTAPWAGKSEKWTL